jgi:hypothetical protein
VFWVIGFCLLAYSTFNIGRQFSSSHKVITSDTLEQMDKQHTLIIKAKQGHDHSEFIIEKENGDERLNITSRQDFKEFLDEKISENIDLKVVRGFGNKPVIKVSKRSAGKNRQNAASNAEKIEYHYEVRDSMIILDDFFSLGSQQLWRNQKLLVTVEIPAGYNLYIDPSCNGMFEYSNFSRQRHRKWDHHHDYYDEEEVTGKNLKIDENGIIIPMD